MLPPTTILSTDASGPSRRAPSFRPGLAPWLLKPTFWAVAFASSGVFLVIGILQRMAALRLAGVSLPWWQILAHYTMPTLTTVLTAVLFLQIGHRYPLELGIRWRRISLYVALGILWSALEITLFAAWTLVAPPVLFRPDAPFSTRLLSLLLGGILQWNVLYCGGMLGLHHAFDYHRRLSRREVDAARLESRLADARLQTLRVQLQPHFLFNTLNAISATALADGSRRSVEMLNRLAEFLRMALEEGETSITSLRRELAFAERYLTIEAIRFEERLRIERRIEPETLTAEVPSLLLQPLLENAVRHGVAPSRKGGRIEIRAARRDDRLALEIWNSLPTEESQRPPTEEPGHGRGLANVRRRLAHLYGAEQSLVLLQENGGMVVRMDLPWRERPEPVRGDDT